MKAIKKRLGSLLIVGAMLAQMTPVFGVMNLTSTQADISKGATTVVLQLDNPVMLVDGLPQNVDPTGEVSPVIRNDRTLLPMRAVVEALGCTVEWNAKTSVATVLYEDRSVEFWLNNKKIRVDKTEVKTIDVAPIIMHERTMLPIRYLEEIGFTVEWEPLTRSVIITNEYITNTINVQTVAGKAIDPEKLGEGKLISQNENDYEISYPDAAKTRAAREAFAKSPDVKFCQPQRVLYTSAFSSYVPEKIGGDRYLAYLGDKKLTDTVKIAILDTGVEYHSNYAQRRFVRGEIDIVNNDNKADDDNGHGTQMAGIITDLTPQNVEILPIKVLDAQGRGTDTDIAQGIRYAVAEEVDVILIGANGSVPNASYSKIIADAVAQAKAAHIPVVAPAGNERLDTKFSVISANDEVFTASSVDKNGEFSKFSNFGSNIVAASYGEDVKTTTKGGKFLNIIGTSASAATLASVLANYKLENDRAKYDDFIAFIEKNTIDKGTAGVDTKYGNGILDFSNYYGSTIVDPGQKPEESGVKTYTIEGDSVSVQYNLTTPIMIKEVYNNGTSKILTFDEAVAKGVKVVSLNEEIATISSVGMVRGIKIGTTDLRLEFKIDGKLVINTIPKGISVIQPKERDYVKFIPSKSVIAVGDTFTVKAVLVYKDGTEDELTGSQYEIISLDKGIVDKISTGEFYGIKEGPASLGFKNDVGLNNVTVKYNGVKVQQPSGITFGIRGIVAEGVAGKDYNILTDARVSVYNFKGEFLEAKTVANNGNYYMFDRLAEGSYKVKVTRSGYTDYSFDASVRSGKNTTIDVDMSQTLYTVSGIAYYENEPLVKKALTYKFEGTDKVYAIVTNEIGVFSTPEKFADGNIIFNYNGRDIKVGTRDTIRLRY